MSGRRRNWCVTIWQNRDKWGDFISKCQQIDDLVYFIGQGEICPTTGREHIQGYLEFGKPLNMHRIKRILGDDTMHLGPRHGTRDEAREYCRKTATRIDDEFMWEVGTWRKQGKRSDLAAVIEHLLTGEDWRPEDYAIYVQYRRGLESLRRKVRTEETMRRMLEHYESFEPYVWQSNLLLRIESPPDPRKILWYWESEGNVGKTYFAKYLVCKYDAFYINGGKGIDIIHAYDLQKIVILDQTRTSEEYVNYGIIEAFKNGMVFSPKYDSCTKVFEIPHVLVFANFAPDLDKLSLDRWCVKKINFSPPPHGGAS